MENTILIMWLAAFFGWLAYQLPEFGKAWKRDDFSWNYWSKNNLFPLLGSLSATICLIFAQPATELALSKMTGVEWIEEVGILISALIGYGGTRIIKEIYRRLYNKLKKTK